MSFHKMPELVPAEYVERARKLNAALLADGMKELGIYREGVMDAEIMPVDRRSKMVGTAMTVETADGDNFPIHVATYSGGEGYVMVIDGKGYKDRAYFGDLIMGAAKAVGFEGMVCDGCVRDREGCINMEFPVFSRGFMQRGPLKKNEGEINMPVRCGGVTVNPGDLIVGDYDGITVVPRERIAEALEKAEKKLEYEDQREITIAKYAEAKEKGEPLPQLAPKWVLDMQK